MHVCSHARMHARTSTQTHRMSFQCEVTTKEIAICKQSADNHLLLVHSVIVRRECDVWCHAFLFCFSLRLWAQFMFHFLIDLNSGGGILLPKTLSANWKLFFSALFFLSFSFLTQFCSPVIFLVFRRACLRLCVPVDPATYAANSGQFILVNFIFFCFVLFLCVSSLVVFFFCPLPSFLWERKILFLEFFFKHLFV